ncbi:MAG: peptidoglycan-binding protein [Betaproteobacteria bacterium]|nr:peptidoglycan-binding protein [Betaproteobacteria bacterium]
MLDRGFNPGNDGGVFGTTTQSAVLAFQRSEGLLADGVARSRTLAAMKRIAAPQLPSILGAKFCGRGYVQLTGPATRATGSITWDPA